MVRQASFLVCLALAAPASAQTVRISIPAGLLDSNGPSPAVAISGNGRYVVYESEANNLVANDSNGAADIFVCDRDADGDGVFTGDHRGGCTTSRLTAPGNVQPNGPSRDPRISADGRFVTFVSTATNLGPAAPGGVSQVYRIDRTTSTIVLISMNDAGVAGDLDSTDPVISDDGNVVAFTSLASTLVGGAATTTLGIFVRDVAAGLTTRITPPGPTSPAHYLEPRLSPDGRRVAYRAINARRPSVFGAVVHDRVLGTTTDLLPQIASAVFLTASGGQAVTVQSIGGDIIRHALDLGTSERFLVPTGANGGAAAVSPSGRFAIRGGGAIDLEFGGVMTTSLPLLAVAFDRNDRWMAVSTTSSALAPTGEDTNGVADIYVFPVSTLFDADQDGLVDGWETRFGVTDPAADPDADGATNAQEHAAGTHPTVAFRRYLAEGATGSFFTTDIALANANPDPAGVLLTFDTGDGTKVRRSVTVSAHGSLTVHGAAQAGLESADFATTVESNRPIGVARTVAWDTSATTEAGRGYGMHLERGLPTPSTTWFLAEGSTVQGFDLFYLLQNPQATIAHATVRFLLPSGTFVTRSYDLAPGSRTTVHVNQVPGLDETDVSGDIAADAPIVVERAMYRSTPGQPFALGTGGAGVTTAATQWFLAEGATGSFFDLFVLIANPGGADASVEARYARPDGTVVTRQYTVRANSRFSVYVDAIPGLESTAVATTITATNNVPIVVERAMYWPGGFFEYYEGHTSAGSTTTAGRWVVAGGVSGGPTDAQTFVLVANTSSQSVAVQYSVLTEPGDESVPPSPMFTLPPNSRRTIPLSAPGGRFGFVIATIGPETSLVVESAVYRSVDGVLWSAGGNALATPLP
jgi:hypothetical protein